MRSALASIQPVNYHPSGTWLGRVARSQVFAWSISLAVHLTGFTAAYVLVVRDQTPPQRVIIPEARLASSAEPISPAAPSSPPIIQPPEPQPPGSAGGGSPLAGVVNPLAGADQLVAIAPSDQSSGGGVWAAGSAPGAIGFGPGLGSGSGTGAGSAGPTSSFFGAAGNAYRVVYVVDMSASLDIYVDDIMNEMRRSIQALVATQQFNIAVTHSETVEQFRRGSLAWANAQNKLQGAEFIVTKMRTAIRGKALPNEAMKEAFSARPELIYFLSDGDYEDVQDAIVNNRRTSLENTLDQLNRDRSVRITVIFFGEGPRQRTILERIAREHGGNFRTVVLK
jgi:hypothetical protein